MANPYYVGSTLDTIGNNMSRDYSTDAQLRAAELHARNQFAQILQQAIQAQADRQQRGGQFDQDIALRQAALAQQGQLRGQELNQNQGQFNSNLEYLKAALQGRLAEGQAERQMRGDQFNQEQAYRDMALSQEGRLKSNALNQSQAQFDSNLAYLRDALKQQLAGNLEATKLQFPPERWKVEDSRIAAERLQQEGMLKIAQLKQAADQARADAEYNSRSQLENDSLKSLASQLNTILGPVKQSATNKAKDGPLWLERDPQDEAYRNTYRSAVDPEISRLVQSIQGQPIRFNPAKEEFEPVLAPLRQTQPLPINQPAQPQNVWGMLLQMIQGQGQPQLTQPLAPQTRTSSGVSGGWAPNFQVGGIYEQNGKKYRFDGTNFTEVASGL